MVVQGDLVSLLLAEMYTSVLCLCGRVYRCWFGSVWLDWRFSLIWLCLVAASICLSLSVCLPLSVSVCLSRTKQNKTKHSAMLHVFFLQPIINLTPPLPFTRALPVVYPVHPPLRVRAQSMGGHPHDIRPRLLRGGHPDEPLRAAACTAEGHGPPRRSRNAFSRR